MNNRMYKLRVDALGGYDVFVGAGIIEDSGRLIKECLWADKIFVIVDENVYRLHFKALAASLSQAGLEFESHVMPSGEHSKSLQEYSAIIGEMITNGFNRNSAVVSFGGGVAGDLAGFVASSYMRGIPVVHIPTTLLSQCDSSVGGKTALDMPAAKNIIGSVWQPKLVVCDTSLLSSLPPSIYADGMGEILKYALLKGEYILNCQNDEEMIFNALKIKAGFISEDEYDNSSRRMLNLGHTAGHAFEALSGYEIPHGYAVALGMEVIIKAAFKRGICDSDFVKKFLLYKRKFGFEEQINFEHQAVLEAISHDKKRRAGKIALVIPKAFGVCFIDEMNFEDACEFIKGGLY